jgi:F-type H+-transporting ATPase subunit delta
MEEVTSARHYARALFGMLPEREAVDRVAAELKLVVEQTRDAADLHRFLFHPEIPLADKRRVLSQILPRDLLPEVTAFLNLLLEHRQLHMLAAVHEAFMALRQERFGVVKAVVESARPLSTESRQQLIAALKAAIGRDIVLVEESCPELIGGVRVHVGDRIIDGSIAGQLNQIRERIRATA